MSFLKGVGDERLVGDEREGERLRERDLERLLERALPIGERLRDRDDDDDRDEDDDFLRVPVLIAFL